LARGFGWPNGEVAIRIPMFHGDRPKTNKFSFLETIIFGFPTFGFRSIFGTSHGPPGDPSHVAGFSRPTSKPPPQARNLGSCGAAVALADDEVYR
jgi:hypothetical protein